MGMRAAKGFQRTPLDILPTLYSSPQQFLGRRLFAILSGAKKFGLRIGVGTVRTSNQCYRHGKVPGVVACNGSNGFYLSRCFERDPEVLYSCQHYGAHYDTVDEKKQDHTNVAPLRHSASYREANSRYQDAQSEESDGNGGGVQSALHEYRLEILSLAHQPLRLLAHCISLSCLRRTSCLLACLLHRRKILFSDAAGPNDQCPVFIRTYQRDPVLSPVPWANYVGLLTVTLQEGLAVLTLSPG